MKLTKAIRLAKQRVFKGEGIQAIVLLRDLSHNCSSYIPIGAWSGLRGGVVGEVDSNGKINVALEELVENQIDEDLGKIRGML